MSAKVMVTGAGQLAWEIKRSCPDDVELIALSRAELDISDGDAVARVMAEIRPDAVINAAAYTAVDKAESDRETAFFVNAEGPRHLAKQCQALSAFFLQVSTDFVFDGSANRPYPVSANVAPIGVYGESKAAGEVAIAEEMARGWAILRTAWVYSCHGNNFVKTMLRLMADKPQLGVVGDQVGTPTWAFGLAQACWRVVTQRVEGIMHWTDAGVASWYDFAVAIQTIALAEGMLEKAIPINSIATEDYPTPAARPSYSVLDKSSTLKALNMDTHPHWQAQLRCMLGELKQNES